MTGPLNVLHVSASGMLGGAERVLLDLITWQRRNKPAWNITLLTFSPGPLTGAMDTLGVRTITLPLPHTLAVLGESGNGSLRLLCELAQGLGAGCQFVQRLRAHASDPAPQVIHSHGLKPHALLALAGIRNAPLLWHMHDYISTRPTSARLLRTLRRRCKMAIAISPSVAEDVRETLGDVPVATVLNGIDVDSFAAAGPVAPLDELSGLPGATWGTIRVGLLATFARWKGHGTFLRALAALSRQPVRGYVIGAPVYQTYRSQYSLRELQGLASALALEGRVGFPGFIDDRAAAIRALDIVVHASTSPEPFGLVIAEAMAAGRPVVVSPLGGAGGLIRAGHDGLLHRPGDAASLAAVIHELASSEMLRVRLGAAAQVSARERFRRERVGEEVADIYQRVRARSRAA